MGERRSVQRGGMRDGNEGMSGGGLSCVSACGVRQNRHRTQYEKWLKSTAAPKKGGQKRDV
jgi:hypothetical protein